MSFLCFLTGAPGVGKSTVSELLAARPGVASLPFGSLIQRELVKQGVSFDGHEDLRERADELVNAEILRGATQALVDEVAWFKKSDDKWLVVDSHAVSPMSVGLRITPDPPSFFKRMSYDVIVQLYAAPDVILSRYQDDPRGRQVTTVEDVRAVDDAQRAVSVLYASLSGCPLYLVDATEDAQAVADSVFALLASA